MTNSTSALKHKPGIQIKNAVTHDDFLFIYKEMDSYCKGLTGADYRLLFHLLRKVERMNIVHGNLTEWGIEIGVATPHASRSMKALVSNYIFARKTRYSWILNPRCAWYGTSEEHEKALAEMENENHSSID